VRISRPKKKKKKTKIQPLAAVAAVIANGSIDSLSTALKLRFCGSCLSRVFLLEMSGGADLCGMNCPPQHALLISIAIDSLDFR
jgi:hypothetical protein